MNGVDGGGGQSSWDAQNEAAAGNAGGGDGYRAVREWGERDKMRERGVPYGSRGVPTDAIVRERMQRFCPDWDGELGWAPPGFFTEEAKLTARADFFEQKQQEEAGYFGPVPYGRSVSSHHSPAPMRPASRPADDQRELVAQRGRDFLAAQASMIKDAQALESADRARRDARWEHISPPFSYNPRNPSNERNY